ncbi:hypothetical protein [Maioricimonas sp. JC845]|uniref:hypothetical protein n=1 Tax=Maioricimonas sp. JC845 TaxID=3232138 RepID=UPI0034596A38
MIRLLLFVTLLSLPAFASAAEPVDIGSRLELFVDDALIDHMSPGCRLDLKRPEPREVVLVTDRPWEGNTCAYYTIFQDGDIYRMYYRGSDWDEHAKKAKHREVACYAESRDGIHWEKPNLGLFEYNGSTDNNIVWDGPGTHNFTPFRDTNPDCPEDQQYKALGVARGGLLAFASADGIHWRLLRDTPVITRGAFDSQNLAFWDADRGEYREYHRTFRDGVRDIQTGTSPDFLNWTDPVFIDTGDAPKEHLYTNAIAPYARAPHILLGFPTRFHPDLNDQVEPTLMVSRNRGHFRRYLDAVIPHTAPEDRSGNRSNYMAWGVLSLPGKPNELSVYGTEAYYTGPDSRLRRFAYRTDGFVSLRADGKTGEAVTVPLTFTGKELVLNLATHEGGHVRVELQDAEGKPLDGFTLEQCQPITGDAIEKTVQWKTTGDVSSLAGKPVRLHLQLKNADVYSYRFR